MTEYLEGEAEIAFFLLQTVFELLAFLFFFMVFGLFGKYFSFFN